MKPAELKRIGKRLAKAKPEVYARGPKGTGWQTALGQRLGYKDGRQIRKWLSGESVVGEPMAAWVRAIFYEETLGLGADWPNAPREVIR